MTPRPFLEDEDESYTTVKIATAIKDTKLALLVLVGGKERWVPKSVIGADSEVWQPGQQGKLVVFTWFAEKEGIA